jgi:preprotein translocase subunit SecA
LQRTFALEPDHLDQIDIQQATGLREQILETLDTAYQKKEDEMTPQVTRELERLITLDRIDSYWKDHLYNVDYLKEGIYLRGYGGKDPIVVFKNEAYEIFELMQERIQDEVCEYAFKARISQQPTPTKKPKRTGVAGVGRLPTVGESDELRGPKVGRNAPCPCGSGKKYKKCCG